MKNYPTMTDRKLAHELAETNRRIKLMQEVKKEIVEAILDRTTLPEDETTQKFTNDFFVFNRSRSAKVDDKDALFSYLKKNKDMVKLANISIPISAMTDEPIAGIHIALTNWALKVK